jgi:hypothetical protein
MTVKSSYFGKNPGILTLDKGKVKLEIGEE